VDEGEIEKRLRDIGIADTSELPVGATLRPPDASVAKTVAAPATWTERSLPRLSVDLRGSRGAEPGDVLPTHEADLEVRSLIGEGGMGRVFLARQHSLRRDVAVKTAKDGAPDWARQAIFVEGAVTGQLEHPAIVPVHALGIDSAGRPAMVMKRIEGVSWHVLAKDPANEGWDGWEGTPDDRLLGHLQILMQICNALHFAHSRGIVHRDVKPENVLIGRFGDVYLADWGIATEVGHVEDRLCGTPGYMAPEMVSLLPVDERTDVYLLGATLHEVLTGRMRHDAGTAMMAIVSAKLSEPFAYDMSVPSELAELVNRACHVEPDERPSDAKTFRDAVLAHIRHRESAVLAAEGAERVMQLVQLLDDDEPDEEQRREIDRLIAEARFGLETALTQWSDNAVAHEALAELERILESRREHAAKLEREARDRDPKIAARSRAFALTFLGMVNAALAVYALVAMDTPSRVELVFFPVLVIGLAAAGAFAQRKSVMLTKFNRDVVVFFFILLGVMLIGRITGLFVPIDPAEHFSRDAFVLAAGMAVGSIAYLRWMAWLSLIFLVTGIACAAVPGHALGIFAVSASIAVFVAAGSQWRST